MDEKRNTKLFLIKLNHLFLCCEIGAAAGSVNEHRQILRELRATRISISNP